MRSTGEVMGLAAGFGEAYAKAALGAGVTLPSSGTVFVSLADVDKQRAPALAARLEELGFIVAATRGTADALGREGMSPVVVNKISEGRPQAVDLMVNGDIQLVINTASGSRARRDGLAIRRGSLEHRIPYVATVAGGFAAAEAIAALQAGSLHYRSLQDWESRRDGP